MCFRRRVRGDSQGGLGPLAGGGQHDKCQRLLLARDVPPAWGEPVRPGFPPGGGNGKEGDQTVFLAAAGFYSSVMTKISLLIRSAQIHYNCSARKQRERWFRRHESGAGFRTEPRNTLLCYRFISSVRLSNRCPLVLRDPCLRLQLRHEPIPLIGYRNHYSASLG